MDSHSDFPGPASDGAPDPAADGALSKFDLLLLACQRWSCGLAGKNNFANAPYKVRRNLDVLGSASDC